MDGAYGGDHPDPVRRLLFLGETSVGDPADWPDYTADPGVRPEHISALIGLACDMALHRGDSDSSTVWAPVHAWRALAQLRAEAGVSPLLALLKLIEDDDAAGLELPEVFGMIGPAAIPHIARFLANRGNSVSSAGTAIAGLTNIVARYGNSRDECIDILVRMLKADAKANQTVAGFAVSTLMDLRAVEAIDTIRDAFRRSAVDISVAGDIEDVEIGLNLRDRRATPAPRYMVLPDDRAPWPIAAPVPRDRPAPVRREKIGRNAPCPCGSGKKYKKCCLQ